MTDALQGKTRLFASVCHPINVNFAEAAGDVVLRDGTRVHIRPIRPEDDHELVDAFDELSPQSVYQRFFAALPLLTEEMAYRLSHVNYTTRMALIAETVEDGEAKPRIMGVARYERVEGDTKDHPEVVELGLTVWDEWHGRGLGRILLKALLRVAESHGIYQYRAEILADNRKILHLLSSEMKVVSSRTRGAVTTLMLASKSADSEVQPELHP